ncbi:MAG TPA: DMT family transporter [Trueperaceae bacterium]|nr:DMT family transporter [Trueperaceae bacterium]
MAARPAHTTPPTNLLLGSVLMLAAMTLLPIMDGLAKGLSERYPVTQVVWARYFFHFAVMLPLLLLRFGGRALIPKRLGLQLVRGGLLLAATTLFFFALAVMPQATVLALFFVSPAVVTVLAPFLLGERVGGWRVVAVLVGFLGVLLILRPGAGVFGWGAVFAILAGVIHGFYMMFTRRLAGSAPPLVTLGYTAVIGAVVMSLLMPYVWVRPAVTDLAIMVLLGVLAASGHFLLIKAFDHAPANWLAPLGYAEIVTAVIYGFAAYGHLPDALTWLGIAVIVGAGVWISVKEQRMVARASRKAAAGLTAADRIPGQ